MTSDTAPMHEYFSKLGFEPEVADIYLALHAYGPQSLLQLSRNARIERTRLYRLIDALIDCNLVEIQEEYKRKTYKAAPLNNLQILLSKREQELRDLQDELQTLHKKLNHESLHSPLTHVQFYRGADGLKQMFWNQTKGKSDNLSILYENMQNKTNLAFFERWVERCNSADINFRGIISDHFVQTQQQWYHTQAHSNERLKNWESRYVHDTTFPITHSTVVYDDVVSYYNWKDGEIFGLEIYNQEIADAQRNFFEMLWKDASPVNDLDGPEDQKHTAS